MSAYACQHDKVAHAALGSDRDRVDANGSLDWHAKIRHVILYHRTREYCDRFFIVIGGNAERESKKKWMQHVATLLKPRRTYICMYIYIYRCIRIIIFFRRCMETSTDCHESSVGRNTDHCLGDSRSSRKVWKRFGAQFSISDVYKQK